MAHSSTSRLAGAAIVISEPPNLCGVQTTTRELCRSIGVDEATVFRAVISVTELAHRLFIERGQAGSLELRAVRRKSGLELDVRAESSGARDVPAMHVNITLSLEAETRYS